MSLCDLLDAYFDYVITLDGHPIFYRIASDIFGWICSPTGNGDPGGSVLEPNRPGNPNNPFPSRDFILPNGDFDFIDYGNDGYSGFVDSYTASTRRRIVWQFSNTEHYGFSYSYDSDVTAGRTWIWRLPQLCGDTISYYVYMRVISNDGRQFSGYSRDFRWNLPVRSVIVNGRNFPDGYPFQYFDAPYQNLSQFSPLVSCVNDRYLFHYFEEVYPVFARAVSLGGYKWLTFTADTSYPERSNTYELLKRLQKENVQIGWTIVQPSWHDVWGNCMKPSWANDLP